jgi:hypothetical protein
VYSIKPDPRSRADVAALPDAALRPYLELLDTLRIDPWSGPSFVPENPTSAIRTMPFGSAGLATYLILEDQKRVDMLAVNWVG